MPRLALLLTSFLACASPWMFAQHSDGYASSQGRTIKALSAEQVQDLLEGRGMGLSLPAELNGSPGPLHVLQLREELHITQGQVTDIERIRADMVTTARRLGAAIIAKEEELDAAFKGGQVSEADIQSMTARVATLSGELRAAHLTAHLQTRRLLTPPQIAAYNAARGYADVGTQALPAHRH